jgi:uncharacterized cysteine cluster protein YcgN (CxxCxxCC family)
LIVPPWRIKAGPALNDGAAFWEKPLANLDRGEWEALCDGCGRCCLHKLEDEDTGQLYPTNVACKLLDRRAGQCTDYGNRKRHVADCVKLDPTKLDELEWLPTTCAYRLRYEGKPLMDWHYLISGSRETVHEAGQSTRGWTISEVDAGELEFHLVDRDL